MIDPRFNLEEFMKEAREFIIPEIMEAYLSGDASTLKEWCSEAVCLFCQNYCTFWLVVFK